MINKLASQVENYRWAGGDALRSGASAAALPPRLKHTVPSVFLPIQHSDALPQYLRRTEATDAA